METRRTELKNLHLEIKIEGLNWKKDKTLIRKKREKWKKIRTEKTKSKTSTAIGIGVDFLG